MARYYRGCRRYDHIEDKDLVVKEIREGLLDQNYGVEDYLAKKSLQAYQKRRIVERNITTEATKHKIEEGIERIDTIIARFMKKLKSDRGTTSSLEKTARKSLTD